MNLKRIPGTPHGLAGSGWIAVDEARIRLTPAGELFADEVAARLWK